MHAAAAAFCRNFTGQTFEPKGQPFEGHYDPFGDPIDPVINAIWPKVGHQNIDIEASMVYKDENSGPGPLECRTWNHVLDETACGTILGTVIDSCQADTLVAKKGGVVRYGCVEWTIGSAVAGADIFRVDFSHTIISTNFIPL
jgi:hypothetical protein